MKLSIFTNGHGYLTHVFTHTFIQVFSHISFIFIFAFASHAHADLDIQFQNCGTELKQKITRAYQRMHFRVTQNREEITRCMDQAYLLENNGHSASKIVNSLSGFEKVIFRCRNMGVTEGQAREMTRNIGDIKLNRYAVRRSGEKYLSGLIAHELSHNRGYQHKTYDKGGPIINNLRHNNTVPLQLHRCVEKGEYWKFIPPGNEIYDPMEMAGFALDGSNNYMFAWSRNGFVTAGTSTRIHRYRAAYLYTIAAGIPAYQIVGMGLDGQNNTVFTWLAHNKVIAGSTDDLDAKRSEYSFKIPERYTTANIVGMATDGYANRHYAWFSDGWVFEGSSDDITKNGRRYELPPGYNFNDIIGMAYDGENKWVFAYYRDGKVSAGTTTKPFTHRPPQDVDTGR